MHIYHIGCITKKDDSKINSVNPLNLLIGEIDGYIECNSVECISTEKDNGNKYLTFSSTEKVPEKYASLWDKSQDEIKRINNKKSGE